jgi:hypothetical protein
MYSSSPAHHDEVLADVASRMLGKGKGTPFDLSSMYLQLPLFHPPAKCQMKKVSNIPSQLEKHTWLCE